jgi:hypothetical protein
MRTLPAKTLNALVVAVTAVPTAEEAANVVVTVIFLTC